MMKSKPPRRKQHQRATRTNLLSLAVVVILIGVSYLLIEQFRGLEEEELSGKTGVVQSQKADSSGSMPAFDPSSQLRLDEIGQRIAEQTPGLEQAPKRVLRTPADAGGLQFLHTDVTGDGRKEWLVIHGYRPASESFSAQTGYEHRIMGFEVLRAGTEGYESLLFVDTKAMRGASDQPLVAQITAGGGYAFETQAYAELPYSNPAMLFKLAILDETGAIASDDLTIYWKPESSAFAATNAFGQPGTFENQAGPAEENL